MDLKEFADNLGLEEDEFFQIMELFVETSASDLSKMTAAVDGGDMVRVVEAAHSIKGASGNLGRAH
jgi:HPt (histidine-containing phosphotransfer) domain-containing protein